ncbi:MAG: beta-ketoacyl synthase N-terminal-like domain-containing protein [Acidobacteriota bacterium]
MRPQPGDQPEVVITGLGFVGAAGLGRAALEKTLTEGPAASLLEAVQIPEQAVLQPRQEDPRALLVGAPDLSPWVHPRAARRLSRPSRFAVAAARMALEDANLDPKDCEAPRVEGEAPRDGEDVPQRTGIYSATTFGPSDLTERLLRQIRDDGPQGASPFYFTESVANAPAAQVALACRARGPNLTLTQREAGPLLALAQAATALRRRRIQRALVIVTEEVTPLLFAFLDHFHALSRSPDGGARPFHRRRDGFLLAEGALALVLESSDSSTAPRQLARVLAGARGFDPTAPRYRHGDGAEALGESLLASLKSQGEELREIDQVVSGASGSRAGDALEASVLRFVFPQEALPPVVTPKAALGEYAGGHLGAAVLAAAGRPSAPVEDFGPDPALAITPHSGSPLSPPHRVLATALAAGGAAAWTLFAAPRIDGESDG